MSNFKKELELYLDAQRSRLEFCEFINSEIAAWPEIQKEIIEYLKEKEEEHPEQIESVFFILNKTDYESYKKSPLWNNRGILPERDRLGYPINMEKYLEEKEKRIKVSKPHSIHIEKRTTEPESDAD